MLKQRIITAVILLAIFIPALLARSPWPFIALAAIMIAAAGWEWARLAGMGNAGAWATGVLCLVACFGLMHAGLLDAPHGEFWRLAALAWVVIGMALLWLGVARWQHIPRGLRWLIGVVALCVAWAAVARARIVGINFLLSVLVLVWAADISAYAAGRKFGGRFTGGRKLAPTISPGKTWEGVAGAVVGVFVVSLLWIALDQRMMAAAPSLYTRLFGHGALPWVAGVIFLVAMSVVGDLVESLVKRSAGVKDSSALLPGHGGVLDRIDALLPTVPIALALASWGG